MANIGRNDPCPCGSGNKYKRCCLAAPTVTKPAATTSEVPSTESQIELCECCLDDLNARADHVLDELLAGHVEQAEALCRTFLRDFPGQAEGLDLLSMILEERGQRQQALDLLCQASAIAHAHPDEYDAETRSMMRERLTELELCA